jgi:uncharacterized protein (UPF0335 family)
MSEDSSGGAPVNINKLKGLVQRIDSKRADADLARSDLGNLYQEAEDYGFNRAALKMALKLRNMEDDKRNDFLSALSIYCDELGVWAQGDLFGHQPRPPDAPAVDLGDLTPYRLGEMAAQAGSEASANPFAVGGAENEAWRDGWTAGWAQGRGVKHDAPAPEAEPRRRGRPRKTGELVH